MSYTSKVHQTCRKFFKNIYDFEKEITEDFVSDLSGFGDLSYNRFSDLIPGSLDMFKIVKGELEITGNVGGKTIYVVIPKQSPDILEAFESKLDTFLK